ncbi:TRAP-type C4-dicarboxylate transport system substrate-binding protein [Hoeflea halophila]|uniref:TRAP-type C4-dicarboxylate transport system substrate-binding protein n=1 Tax=Hoeflea halophila TaxID=714899 RepID=A0A286IFY3_9HYPH|nr:TRAP transporter substrate-binding protein [Hoeflea halophila]SOE19010.1 TRAP-type C4-dicarboxylate transport system substrate-binding protein [Hoeflea halophila]
MTKETKRFTLTRRALGAIAAVSLMLPFAGSAYAQSTMKLASATINDVQHEWQKEFQKEVGARVGDALNVELYPASQLGAIPRMAEGVLLGTIEAFTTPTSFVTNVDPRFQAFDVPGLFVDANEVGAVIHDEDFRDYLETLFLDKGVRIIGAIFNSPTQILTREPVTTLEGFKGLKVRTFASPLQMEPMAALGVNPTPLALSEVTPQLQAGGIDGMLAGIPILSAFKFYDTAKHVTNIDMTQLVSVTLVNEAWFQSQPEEVRTAIIEAGRAAEKTVFPWGVENVERAEKAWLDNGGEVHTLTEDQKNELHATFAKVAEEVIADQPEVVEVKERIAAKLKEVRSK